MNYKYTIYIIRTAPRTYRSVLMSRNGKPILNEACKRPIDIENTFASLADAIRTDCYEVKRVGLAEFKRLHPKYPINSGPKKKTAAK